MAFNGSGVYSLPSPEYPAVSGTLIVAATRNTIDADIATALSTVICKDGQTTITANIPMANFKLTGLAAGSSAGDSVRYEQLNGQAPLSTCDFRLTLTTGVPVTTADVTAAETLYFAPYRGNRIALYDGSSAWAVITSAQMSIDVPDATNCYDVFCYNNGGTATLELTAWTNETTRATALTTQDGVLVKTGATTRRYVGTFYSTTAGNGQIEDSIANRYLWNYYNRVRRPMRVLEGTDTWSYSTGTIRQANGSTANQLNFVIGVVEDMVSAKIVTTAASDLAASNIAGRVGIGLDTTSAFTTGNIHNLPEIVVASRMVPMVAELVIYTGVGKRYLSWNEYGPGSGTTTWQGDGGNASFNQSGIHGELLG